jgi:hypothetical protein
VETQAFGEATLGDVLRKVAELDGWYLACLTGTPPVPLPDDPAQAIAAADRHFRRHAAASYDAFRDLVATADGEEWTFAKMIRRRTGHFREHVPEFERQLPLSAPDGIGE